MRIAAVLFLLIGANSCFGGLINGAIGTVTFSRAGTYGTTNGGEFKLSGSYYDASGSLLSSFSDVYSFCVEKNEYLSIGPTFRFAITDYAVMGGNGGQDPDGSTRDPLDDKSKIIFNDWLDNRAAVAAGDQTDADNYANNVQNALWKLEDEQNYNPSGSAALIAGATGTVPASIRVLNVFSIDAEWDDLSTFVDNNDGELFDSLTSSIVKQDQIIRVEDEETPVVPEPTSAAIFALCVGLLGTRRMRSRS